MPTFRAVWSPEDGEYVGLCDEFPSLSWLAPSPEDTSVTLRLEALRGSVGEAWKQAQQKSEPYVAVDPDSLLAWWGNGGWHNGGWHNGSWGNGGASWHNGGWGNGGAGWHNGFRNW